MDEIKNIRPGTDRGLEVIIDRNFDRWEREQTPSLNFFRVSDGSVFTNSAGFRLFLGQSTEFPFLQVNASSLEKKPKEEFRRGTSPSHLGKNTLWKSAEAGSQRPRGRPCGNWRVNHQILYLTSQFVTKSVPDRRQTTFISGAFFVFKV